jgi:hypothetical protein
MLSDIFVTLSRIDFRDNNLDLQDITTKMFGNMQSMVLSASNIWQFGFGA